MIATSMPQGTFSAWDIKRWLQESTPLPRKRQPQAEGGEDLNKQTADADQTVSIEHHLIMKFDEFEGGDDSGTHHCTGPTCDRLNQKVTQHQ